MYSTPASNSFNYDPSTHFLDFEDASSITSDSTVSPATSIDSLEALKSPLDSEFLIDDLYRPQSDNRTNLSFPQGATVGRALYTHPASADHMLPTQQFSSNIIIHTATPFPPNTHDMPRALRPLIDDGRSSISELEVEDRDRIAKINAEYNAISQAAFFMNNSASSHSPKYSPDRTRESNTVLQSSSRPPLHLTVSQPRHPDLHFPPRPNGNQKKDSLSSPYRIYASPVFSVPLDLSPPSVERLPSQPAPDQNVNPKKNKPHSQSSPPAGSRNHEGTPDSDRSRIVQNITSSPMHLTYSVPQTELSSNVGVNPQLESHSSRAEKNQTLESSSVLTEIPRKRGSSVVTHSPHPSHGDVQDILQFKPQSRADVASSFQPSVNQVSTHNTSPDLRQNADVLKSSPLAQNNKAAELENPERIFLGTSLRKDTKTPGLPNRGLSYVESITLESPPRSSRDVHSSPDLRDKDVLKSGSKSSSESKSGSVDNGRSPGEAKLSSSDVPLSEHSSSVSHSTFSLPHEEVISKRAKKEADEDRVIERNRFPHNNGAERVAKFTDDAFHDTAPGMHTQDSLHSSPESAPCAFPQPDSSINVSEPRTTNPNQSRTIYEPNMLNSRDSLTFREYPYGNSVKPLPETTTKKGNDMHVPATVIQSSPLNKFATTSSPPSSKVMLDSPPTTVLPEPHRRHSDGDQVGPPIRPHLYSRNSAPLIRSVRWTENLVAPSPILAPPRRKGWFNRRG